MASLLLGLGVLSYHGIKTQREKSAKKKEHNASRFTALERENAERVANLHDKPESGCSCRRAEGDWQGRGECERCVGFVHMAGERADGEIEGRGEARGMDIGGEKVEQQTTSYREWERGGRGLGKREAEKGDRERRGRGRGWGLRRKGTGNGSGRKEGEIVR
ncbi:hypothetical protein MMC21_004929 [Puttea exsequens]|nr:hypothetical protein [Puttea exsequens]